MFVSEEKKENVLALKSEIEKYFSVSLEFLKVEGEIEGNWLSVEGPMQEEATEFLEILIGNFPSTMSDDVPFSSSLKPVLKDSLGGYFAKMIRFQYKVLINGLEENTQLLQIQGRNRENKIRFNLIS